MNDIAFVTTPSDAFVEALARRVAELVPANPQSKVWLDVQGVADYLCATPDAVRGMVKRRQIPCHRTPTGRLLFDTAEIDACVRSGADG